MFDASFITSFGAGREPSFTEASISYWLFTAIASQITVTVAASRRCSVAFLTAVSHAQSDTCVKIILRGISIE